MERLTSYKGECRREMICRYEDCDTCKEYCPYMNEDNCPCLQEVLEKLAEYEDIGLTPEQLREIDKLYAEKCKELADAQRSAFSGLELAQIWGRLKKLTEYEDLEEQGKLLKLPCAVGDTVYVVERSQIGSPMIAKTTADSFYCALWMLDGKFGRSIFTTPEAAESALKEL